MRLGTDRRLEMAPLLVQAPELPERFAQITSRHGKIGLNGERALIAGHRPLELAQLLQRIRQIVVRLSVVRPGIDCLLKMLDGLRRLSSAGQMDAKTIV